MKKRTVKKIFDKVFNYYWFKTLSKDIKKCQKKDNLFLKKFSTDQNQTKKYLKKLST